MTAASPVLKKRSNELAPDADVVVIGAGPAGMSAAIEVASAGHNVIVLDLQPTPGGQIFRAFEANFAGRPTTDRLLAALGPTYASGSALIEKFRATPGIDFRPETTVWDLRPDGTVGWLKDDSAGYLRARHILLANGAMERPTPFPGWTLPGVMTAGAVQTLIKAGRLQPEGRIILAGTGPLIFLLADQLHRLGVRPAMIARTDRLLDKIAAVPRLRLAAVPSVLKGLGWLARLRLAGIPMRSGITGLRAEGNGRVERMSMTVSGKRVAVPCDLLVVHDGIVPAIDLAHCAGLALEWRKADASWRPKTSKNGLAHLAPGPTLVPGPCRIHVSGDARMIGGADAALAHGRYAAKAILDELSRASAGTRDTAAHRTAATVQRAMAARSFLDVAFPPGLAARLPDDATIVCRCEEITAGALRQAIHKGATDMNLIRGALRCGMGPCQGRNCAVTLACLLADASTLPPAPPVPFRARPPLRPLPIGALAKLTGLNPELAKVVSLDDKPAVSVGESHG